MNFRDARWRLVDEGGGVGLKEQDCKREYENVGNMARRVELQPCVNAVETKVMAAIRQHPENVAAVTGDRCNYSDGQSKLSRTVCRRRSSFLQEPILFFFTLFPESPFHISS